MGGHRRCRIAPLRPAHAPAHPVQARTNGPARLGRRSRELVDGGPSGQALRGHHLRQHLPVPAGHRRFRPHRLPPAPGTFRGPYPHPHPCHGAGCGPRRHLLDHHRPGPVEAQCRDLGDALPVDARDHGYAGLGQAQQQPAKRGAVPQWRPVHGHLGGRRGALRAGARSLHTLFHPGGRCCAPVHQHLQRRDARAGRQLVVGQQHHRPCPARHGHRQHPAPACRHTAGHGRHAWTRRMAHALHQRRRYARGHPPGCPALQPPAPVHSHLGL